MSRKKNMTPAQKAAARWDTDQEVNNGEGQGALIQAEEQQAKPQGKGGFILALVLIGVLSIASVIYSMMQAGTV